MFCKVVWNGIHILPNGYTRLCSIGQNTKKELDMQHCRDRDGKRMHILTSSIMDIMNSDKHREVRKLNIENPNAWSPHCDCCENREIVTGNDRNHPNVSRRIGLMPLDTDDICNEHNYMTKASPDGVVDWMPSSLDIRFGNLCNQKCIMCSPIYSTLWYDEYAAMRNSNTIEIGPDQIIKKDPVTGKWIEPENLEWYNDPRWWPKFDEMAPYLKHIYITGGEPMVTPAHDTMLDRLIESGYAKNIVLEYDTNCSAINHKIIERWYHFKQIVIRGSMDAIEGAYELIRFGGTWEKFKKNIETLREHQKKSNGRIVLASLSVCYQVATAKSIIDAENWCNSIGVPLHLRFLDGPEHHSVKSLPPVAKQKLVDFYTPYLQTSKKADMIVSYLNRFMDEQHHKPNAVKQFVKFMDFLDKSRKTEWRTVLPEISELINVSITEA